jgi:SH3-like domain-containing protein
MARPRGHVDGYEDFLRDLKTAEKNIRNGVRKEIRQAAEPVKATAESLAVSRIRGVDFGEPWSRMRVGVTQKSVYVAPRRRGSKAGLSKRPNFADLLMNRAMEPALEQHQDEVVRDIDSLIGREAARFNRG